MKPLKEHVLISEEAKQFLEEEYRRTGMPQGRTANNLILREKRRREFEQKFSGVELESEEVL